MMLFRPYLVAPMTRGQFRWTGALVAFASCSLVLCVLALVLNVRAGHWVMVPMLVVLSCTNLLIIAWNGTALRLRHLIIPWSAHRRLEP